MTEKRFTSKVVDWWHNVDEVRVVFDRGEWIDADGCAKLLNALHEENQLLKEEKKLLKNKLDRIEDILPHYLSCAEISEFRGKTVKEDLALMKCWNKRYQK